MSYTSVSRLAVLVAVTAISFQGALAAKPRCLERLSNELQQAGHVSGFRPSAGVDIEQGDFNQLYKDVVALQPGHRVTLSVSGNIDVNRHYWEERKCKWLGLKCWYEPRERSNWQGIGARHVQLKLCPLRQRGGACRSIATISSATYNGLHGAAELAADPQQKLANLQAEHDLIAMIDGNGVHRGRCTGARPSTCSFGAYRIDTRVDVKPRLDALTTLLKRRQEVEDLVHPKLIDRFMRQSNSARKVAGCRLFEHAQAFHAEVAGAANSKRERLLRYIINDLDGDNEYRIELTSLLITSGAIDEALSGAEEQLESARKLHYANKNDLALAGEYARALLNRARLWIEDRVATEGADLEVAVGLFDELVRVREHIYENGGRQHEHLQALAQAQIESARLSALIRTSNMLEQAESGLHKVLARLPLNRSEEIAGSNDRRGVYTSFQAPALPLTAVTGRGTSKDGTDSTAAPEGSIHLARIPSWSARTSILANGGRRHPALFLEDPRSSFAQKIWQPAMPQATRSWRLIGRSDNCPDELAFLGGAAAGLAQGDEAPVLYFKHPKGEIWQYVAASAAGCRRIEPDAPGFDTPTGDEVQSVNHLGRLLYARKQVIFAVARDASTGKFSKAIAQNASRPFPARVAAIVQSSEHDALLIHVQIDPKQGQTGPRVHRLYHFADLAALGAFDKDTVDPKVEFETGRDTQVAVLALSAGGFLVRAGEELYFIRQDKIAAGDSFPLSLDAAKDQKFTLAGGQTHRFGADIVGEDFVLIGTTDPGRSDSGKEIEAGARSARIIARIAGRTYDAALTAGDGLGFRPHVVLSHLGPERKRFRVQAFASAISGELFKTDLQTGVRRGSAAAEALLSSRVAVLDRTGMLLSTRLVANHDDPAVYRSVPAFHGRTIADVVRYCTQHSAWGCRVVPLASPVGAPATGAQTSCLSAGTTDSVEDSLLLIAVGRDKQTGGPPTSDQAALARVTCDPSGTPTLAAPLQPFTPQLPVIDEITGPSGKTIKGPVWRYAGPDGAVGPSMAGAMFAALPTGPIDANYRGVAQAEFGRLDDYRLPVRWLSQAQVAGGMVAVRSPFGIRHLLPALEPDSTSIDDVFVISDRPGSIIGYRGDGETARTLANLTAAQAIQLEFAQSGRQVMLGLADTNADAVEVARIRHRPATSGFEFGPTLLGNGAAFWGEWNAMERTSAHMRFQFFGTRRDQSWAWLPDSRCTTLHVLATDGKLQTAVGRIAGLSHLKRAVTAQPVTIQRRRAQAGATNGLRSSQPYTESWKTLGAGASRECASN